MRISERIWPADEKSTGWILLCYYLGSVILFELDEYKIQLDKNESKGQILRSTPNTAPLICGACNTQPEGLSTMA